MEISDIRVRLVKDANERLKSVCSITFDEQFVVRDVKIVEGTHGLFVAMPSRKLSFPCSKCRTQNHLRARFCNECGAKLAAPRIPADGKGREKAHRDIAHPITPEFRQAVQEQVLEAYHSECDKAEDNGYTPASLDVDDHHEVAGGASEYDSLIADLKGGGGRNREGGGDRDGESSGRPDERRRRRRDRRGDRDRDEGERPAVAEKGHDEPETPPAERACRASEPGERDAAFAPTDERNAEPESGFGVGITEREERKPVPAPAAEVEPVASEPARPTAAEEEPPTPDEKKEEETEFGAGIL